MTEQRTKKYTVRLADGSLLGPYDGQAVERLIKQGQLSQNDFIAEIGGTFTLLSKHSQWIRLQDNEFRLDSFDVLQGIPPALVYVFKEEKQQTPTVKYMGQLSEISLPRLLYFLHTRQLTGRLLLTTTNSESREIFWAKGSIAKVEAPQSQERLQQRLLAHNLCEHSAFQAALQKTQDTGGMFVEHLVMGGGVNPHQLFEIMQEHDEQELLGCFGWLDGRYFFYEEDESTSNTFYSLNIYRLIFQGIQQVISLKHLKWSLESHYNSQLSLPESPYVSVEKIGLVPKQMRLWNQIPRTKTLWELIDRATRMNISDQLGIHQLIYFLAQIELLYFNGNVFGLRIQENAYLLDDANGNVR